MWVSSPSSITIYCYLVQGRLEWLSHFKQYFNCFSSFDAPSSIPSSRFKFLKMVNPDPHVILGWLVTRIPKRIGVVAILSPWILKTSAGIGSSHLKSMMPTIALGNVRTPSSNGIHIIISYNRLILRGLEDHVVRRERCRLFLCFISIQTPTLSFPFFQEWLWTSVVAHKCFLLN